MKSEGFLDEIESRKSSGFLDSPDYWRFSKMFSGLETMGGLWDGSDDELLKLTPEPRETKAAAANLQWLAFQEEASVDDLAPVKNLYLDVHSKTWFDGQAGEDISFYDRMRGEFDKQNQWNIAVSDLPRYVVGSLIDGDPTGSRGGLLGMSQWMERYRDVLRPDQEAALLRAGNGFAEEIQPFLSKQAPLVRRMYDTMAGYSGREGSDPAGGADVAGLVRDIAKLPVEEQDKFFGVAALYARYLGMDASDQKGFFTQFGESVVRGTTEPGNAMIDKGEEVRLSDELSLLQRVERGDFVPEDISTFMLNESARLGRMGEKEQRFWQAERNGEGSAVLRGQRMQEIQSALGLVATSRRLRQYGSGEVDPIKPIASGMLGKAEGALYSVGRALPVMALTMVPLAGPGGAGLAYSANEYERIRTSYPDMPISQAQSMADISGGAQAVLGLLQVKTVLGGLPVTSKLLDALSQPGQGYIKRIGVAAGLNATEELGEETLQNAAPFVVDALAHALGADMPGYDWKKELEAFRDMQPETLINSLPFLLAGAGAISVREARRGRRFHLEAPAMVKVGLSADEARAIAAERDPNEQGRKFQAAWMSLPVETKRAAILATDADIRNAKAEREAGHPPKLEVRKSANTAEEWIVRDDEGNEIYRTPDEIAAGVALETGRIAASPESNRVANSFSTGRAASPRWLTSEAQNEMEGSDARVVTISEVRGRSALADVAAGDESGGSYEYVSKSEFSKLGLSSLEAAERLAGLFGRGIVVFQNKSQPWLGGIVNRAHPDKIFIHVDAPHPYWSVAGHELWHNMQLDRPDLVEGVINTLRPDILNFDKIEQRVVTDGYAKDSAIHELMGDFLGNQVGEAKFWDLLANKNPSLFKSIADAVRRWLDKVIGLLRRNKFDVDGYFRDIERARETVAQAVAEFAAKEKGPVGPREIVDPNQNFYARASDQKYRDIDKQWWKDFADWRAGRFSRKRQFSFGDASDELILAGFPDAEIVMPAHVLEIKPSSEKHPFPVEKLFNLPKRLRDPVAVFRSRTVSDAMTVLTEIEHYGEHMIVAVHFKPVQAGTVEISSIRSVYPKNAEAIMGWINDGLATYYKKEKARNWLFQQTAGSNSQRAWLQLQATKNIKTDGDLVKPYEPLTEKGAIDFVTANHEHPIARALKMWFDEGFETIQRGEAPEVQKQLEDFLKQLPKYTSSEAVFRGIRFKSLDELHAFLADLEKGTLPHNLPFLSASRDIGVAIAFARSSNFPVILIVQKHFSGRSMEGLANAVGSKYNQKEILFTKQARMKVVSAKPIDFKGKTVYQIILEEAE